MMIQVRDSMAISSSLVGKWNNFIKLILNIVFKVEELEERALA